MNSLGIHPFARRLSACCQALHLQGLSPGRTGVVSARDENLLWMTPRALRLGDIQPETFLVCWPDDEEPRIAAPGFLLPPQTGLHREVYRLRPNVFAIAQVPAPKTLAWAAWRREIASASVVHSLALPSIDEESALRVGVLTGNTDQDALLDLCLTRDLIVIPGQSVLMLALSPEEALSSLEAAESAASIQLWASLSEKF